MPNETKEAPKELKGSGTLTALADPESKLTSLNIDRYADEVDDATVTRLLEILFQNSTLGILHLRNRPFSKESLEKMDAMLRVNTTLRHLNLSSTHLSPPFIPYLTRALEVNITLTMLELDNNPLGDTGTEPLATALTTNRGLAVLRLNFCEIGSMGAKQLAAALKINRSLVSLGLKGNEIDNQGAIELALALSKNQGLTGLDLAYNNIDDKVTASFSSALRANRKLTTLNLRQGNSLDTQSIKLLGTNIQDNQALVYQAFDAIYADRPDQLADLIRQGAAMAAQPNLLGWKEEKEIGWTPLMVAARLNRYHCAHVLLPHSMLWSKGWLREEAKKVEDERSVDINKTALGIAENRQHYALAGLIWSHMRKRWPTLKQRTLVLAKFSALLECLLPKAICELTLEYFIGYSRTKMQHRIRLGQTYLKHLEGSSEGSSLPASALMPMTVQDSTSSSASSFLSGSVPATLTTPSASDDSVKSTLV